MHFFVSDDANERLNQLNELMTELVFHFEKIENDKLLLIKLNLSKWCSQEFTISDTPDASPVPFAPSEETIIYKTYSLIGELLLFRKSKEDAAKIQDYALAADFRDKESDAFVKLLTLKDTLTTSLPWFRYSENTLYMRTIDHFYLNSFIEINLELKN
jgi:hypothetical protein